MALRVKLEHELVETVQNRSGGCLRWRAGPRPPRGEKYRTCRRQYWWRHDTKNFNLRPLVKGRSSLVKKPGGKTEHESAEAARGAGPEGGRGVQNQGRTPRLRRRHQKSVTNLKTRFQDGEINSAVRNAPAAPKERGVAHLKTRSQNKAGPPRL